jgi:hypothetical protein
VRCCDARTLHPQLERSTTPLNLATQTKRLAPAPDHRNPRYRQGHDQLADAARPQLETRSPAASPEPRRFPLLVPRPTGSSTRPLALGRRGLWLPGAGLDPRTNCRIDSPGMWLLLPSRPCWPLVQSDALESTKAGTQGAAVRRSCHGTLASEGVARH